MDRVVRCVLMVVCLMVAVTSWYADGTRVYSPPNVKEGADEFTIDHETFVVLQPVEGLGRGLTWHEANSACFHLGYDLAEPDNPRRLAAYLRTTYGLSCYWLGGRGTGGNVVWPSGLHDGLTESNLWEHDYQISSNHCAYLRDDIIDSSPGTFGTYPCSNVGRTLVALCELRFRTRPSLPLEWTPETDACIRGFNNLVLDGVSLDDCKDRCLAEEDFYCSSVEYHSRSRRCSLSEISSHTPYGYLQPCPYRGWTFTEIIEWTPETNGCFIRDNAHGRYITLDTVSLDDCKARCQSRNFLATTGYFCRSVEYHSRSRSCLIGEANNSSRSYVEPCPRRGWTYTQVIGLFDLPPAPSPPASVTPTPPGTLTFNQAPVVFPGDLFSDAPEDAALIP